MKIKNLFLILFVSVAIASYGQSGMTLTGQDLTNSQTFKNTAGSDRAKVFERLTHLIITDANQHYSATPATNFTSQTELIVLLGTPDFQNTDGDVIGYYLKSINGDCKVVFGLNQSHLTLYYSIHDCN